MWHIGYVRRVGGYGGWVNRKFSASNAIKPVRVIELNWKISERQLLFVCALCNCSHLETTNWKLKTGNYERATGNGNRSRSGTELKNWKAENWTALDRPDPLPRPVPLIICTISLLLLCSRGEWGAGWSSSRMIVIPIICWIARPSSGHSEPHRMWIWMWIWVRIWIRKG